jgi:hypothetical protein
MWRQVGFALVALGVVVGLAASWLSPAPAHAGDFGRTLGDDEADASRVRFSSFGARVHSYDEARDETLLLIAICNHWPCGPAVRVAGDHRATPPDAPRLFVPIGDAPLRTERVAAPAHDIPGGSRLDEAYSLTFEMRDPAPPFLARAASWALVLAGVALALARAPWAVLAPAVAAILGAQARESAAMLVIPMQIGGAALFVGALLVGIVRAIQTRRPPPVPVALAAAAVTLIAVGILANRYFPDDL